MAGTQPSPADPTDVAFPSGDGSALRAWHWTHPAPRAILTISHGLGEHGGSYRQVAEMIATRSQVDVLAFDYRGHGRSAGPRGVVRTYQDLEADLLAALGRAAELRPGIPRFLLGHSNGGLVAARVVADGDRGLAGLILSNPALRLATRVPRWKKTVGRILSRLAPNATLSTGLRELSNTQDPAMIAAMAADPLRHGRIGPSFFFGMIEAGTGMLGRADQIRLPTLMILGGADPIIDPAASRAFFNQLGSSDKTLQIEPEMRHEPFNEIGRERVVADVAAWIEARV
ncbi:lysophospholipase [Tundrisphaera sp. TA3]|uniref:alpha/beta hydrolase n=1 Tax=Tundrisphaera sp. TA3 TaxID=3435775 RepID=UPI003EBBE7E8